VARASAVDQNADGQHESLVVIAGNGFSLHCSSTDEIAFLWSYCRFGHQDSSIIYINDRIDPGSHLADKVTASICNSRSCTFDVHNVQLGDAGFFICMPYSPTIKKTWSVTVLGKY